jgi:hypothetical protein
LFFKKNVKHFSSKKCLPLQNILFIPIMEGFLQAKHFKLSSLKSTCL